MVHADLRTCIRTIRHRLLNQDAGNGPLSVMRSEGGLADGHSAVLFQHRIVLTQQTPRGDVLDAAPFGRTQAMSFFGFTPTGLQSATLLRLRISTRTASWAPVADSGPTQFKRVAVRASMESSTYFSGEVP